MHSHQTLHAPMVHTPKLRPFYGKNRPQKGRFRNNKSREDGQTQAIPTRISKPAFLSRPHLPKTARFAPELRAFKKIEREFKTSLSNLCTLYSIDEPKVEGIFPMNIERAFKELRQMLNCHHKDLQLKIMQDESGTVTLTTRRVFDTRMTLYYLPLCPLWELMMRKDKKPETALILSILAYLFQIGGVPHFAQTCSYFDGIYQMVAEWDFEQEQDEEAQNDAKFISAHFSMMYQAGNILHSKMNDPIHLKCFKGRVKRFKPKDQQGEALFLCAKNALKLYQAFPLRSVMDNMGLPDLESEDDSFIRCEQYLSFYWSNSDCIIDSAMDYINAELNEMCEMEEPVSFQYFDAPQAKETHDFAFEEQFFALLNEITDILNDLK